MTTMDPRVAAALCVLLLIMLPAACMLAEAWMTARRDHAHARHG